MTPLLVRSDLARLLRLSPRSLDRHRAAGAILDPLPGHGHPRWSATEVDAWLGAGRPPATAWRHLRPRRKGA